MELQLLFDFNVVSDFSLVVLQLSLILFRREVKRVECGGELGSRSIVYIEAAGTVMFVTTDRCVLFLLKPDLHDVFKLGLDVGQDVHARQVA